MYHRTGSFTRFMAAFAIVAAATCAGAALVGFFVAFVPALAAPAAVLATAIFMVALIGANRTLY